VKRLIRKDEKIWEDNPLAQILLYAPAGIITSILIFPLVLLSLPIGLFNRKSQHLIMKVLLTIQNTIGLSFWYFVSAYFFPDIIEFPYYADIPICLLFVYVNFKETIGTLTKESLEKGGFII
jgi:hypothetical protein